jgi:hypothetical protein
VGAFLEPRQTLAGKSNHRWAQVPPDIPRRFGQLFCQEAIREAACAAAKLANSFGCLKSGVTQQFVDGRVFIERLSILFRTEAVIKRSCIRACQHRRRTSEFSTSRTRMALRFLVVHGGLLEPPRNSSVRNAFDFYPSVQFAEKQTADTATAHLVGTMDELISFAVFHSSVPFLGPRKFHDQGYVG